MTKFFFGVREFFVFPHCGVWTTCLRNFPLGPMRRCKAVPPTRFIGSISTCREKMHPVQTQKHTNDLSWVRKIFGANRKIWYSYSNLSMPLQNNYLNDLDAVLFINLNIWLLKVFQKYDFCSSDMLKIGFLHFWRSETYQKPNFGLSKLSKSRIFTCL